MLLNVLFLVVVLIGVGVVWIIGFVVGLDVVVVVIESFVLYLFLLFFFKFDFEVFMCNDIKLKGVWVFFCCIFKLGIGEVVDLIFVLERVVGFVDILNGFVVIVFKVVVGVGVFDFVVIGVFVVDKIILRVVDFIGLEVEDVDIGDVIWKLVDCVVVVVGIVWIFVVVVEDVVDVCKFWFIFFFLGLLDIRIFWLLFVVDLVFLVFK